MAQRIATSVALLAFAACLVAGTFGAGNPFTTTVLRALSAMAGTYVVGLVVGLMVRRTIDENLAATAAEPAAGPAGQTPVKSAAGQGR